MVFEIVMRKLLSCLELECLLVVALRRIAVPSAALHPPNWICAEIAAAMKFASSYLGSLKVSLVWLIVLNTVRKKILNTVRISPKSPTSCRKGIYYLYVCFTVVW